MPNDGRQLRIISPAQPEHVTFSRDWNSLPPLLHRPVFLRQHQVAEPDVLPVFRVAARTRRRSRLGLARNFGRPDVASARNRVGCIVAGIAEAEVQPMSHGFLHAGKVLPCQRKAVARLSGYNELPPAVLWIVFLRNQQIADGNILPIGG